jgi:hypothetical protein
MRFLDFSNPLSHPIYRYATMYFLSDRRYFEKASRAVAASRIADGNTRCFALLPAASLER